MKRIQRRRTKGWRKPPNTVNITRPGRWGNPFLVSELGAVEAVQRFKECLEVPRNAFYYFAEGELTPIKAHKVYNHFLNMRSILHQLEGKDLMCFCKEGEPCHGDVLIEEFNNINGNS